MNAPVKIDVLLATFQGEAYLEAQLDSILAQTVPVRILISDDGSTDGTRELLEQYKMYYPDQIVLTHRVKEGRYEDRPSEVPAPAMNFFWLMSRTDADYILLSDQDDVWDSLKVERLLERMKDIETQGCPVLVYSDMEVVDAGLNQVYPSFLAYERLDPGLTSFSHILVENPVTGGALMMNRKLAQIAGQVPEACFMHDWWIALCASCFGVISCVREPLSFYRQHGANVLGARRTLDMEDLRTRPGRQKEVKSNYLRMFRQAAAFGRQFHSGMSAGNRRVLRAFLDLPGQKPMRRLENILRYRFVKSLWVQTLAQCVTIPQLTGRRVGSVSLQSRKGEGSQGWRQER
ncbi:MAG: glycosyltransferase family 2 protein [Hungatella sp.]|nr:glycosyltransferase family 2 protein [Hungatella sp.]